MKGGRSKNKKSKKLRLAIGFLFNPEFWFDGMFRSCHFCCAVLGKTRSNFIMMKKGLLLIFSLFLLLMSCGLNTGGITLSLSLDAGLLESERIEISLSMEGEVFLLEFTDDGNGVHLTEKMGLKAGVYDISIKVIDIGSGIAFWVKTGKLIIKSGLQTRLFYHIEEQDLTYKGVIPPDFRIDQATIYDPSVDYDIISSTPKSSVYYKVGGAEPVSGDLTTVRLFESSLNITAMLADSPNLADGSPDSNVVYAFATREGWDPSAVVSFNFKRTTIPTVINEHLAGSIDYATEVKVKMDISLLDLLLDSFLYYTTDGVNPICGGDSVDKNLVVPITNPCIVKVVTFSDGYLPSDIVPLEVKQLSPPDITPPASISLSGTYDFSIVVGMGDTPDSFYYSIDGPLSGDSSQRVLPPFPFEPSISMPASGEIPTLNIVAAKKGYLSSPLLAFVIEPAPAPTFFDGRAESGEWWQPFSFGLSSTHPNVSFFYTKDESLPITTSPEYIIPVVANPAVTTLKAMVTATDRLPSSVTDQLVDSFASGASHPLIVTLAKLNMLSITSSILPSDPDHKIYYTMDGSDPEVADPPFLSDGNPFQIPQATTPTLTVNARLSAPFSHNSEVKTLTIATEEVDPVAVDARLPEAPAPGKNLFDPLELSFVVPAGGSEYYYSLTGVDPFSDGGRVLYTTPIVVGDVETLKIFATKEDSLSSETVVYSGPLLSLPSPILTLEDDDTVTIAMPTGFTPMPDHKIYYYKYTGDSQQLTYGTGVEYTTPPPVINIVSGETIDVIAVAPFQNPSLIATRNFSISPAPVFLDGRELVTDTTLSIAIEDLPADATIYYTTSTTGTLPADPNLSIATKILPGDSPRTISIPLDTTFLKAIIKQPDIISSAVGTMTFEIFDSPLVFDLPPINSLDVTSPFLPTGTTGPVKLFYSYDNAGILVSGEYSVAIDLPRFIGDIGVTVQAVEALQRQNPVTKLTHPHSQIISCIQTTAIVTIADGRGSLPTDFRSSLSVSLTSSATPTDGYYSLDGSALTTTSSPLTIPTASPIAIADNQNFEALFYETDKLALDKATIDADADQLATVDGTSLADVEGNINIKEDTIELTCTDSGVTIFYTTDGSDPTIAVAPNLITYGSPIAIVAGFEIKAIAVKNLRNPSSVVTFQIDESVKPVLIDGRTASSDDLSVAISNLPAGAEAFYGFNGDLVTTPYVASSIVVTAEKTSLTVTIKEAGKSLSAESVVDFATVTGPVTFHLDGFNLLTLTEPVPADTDLYFGYDAASTATTAYTTPLLLNSIQNTVNTRLAQPKFASETDITGKILLRPVDAFRTYSVTVDPMIITDARTGGDYRTELSITLGAGAGDNIYYTLTGSLPTATAQGNLVVGSISIPSAGANNLKALSVATGKLYQTEANYDGGAPPSIDFSTTDVVSGTPLADVAFQLVPGGVKLTASAGATIYCTSDPNVDLISDSGLTPYSNGVVFPAVAGAEVKAIAVQEFKNRSKVTPYTVPTRVTTPVIEEARTGITSVADAQLKFKITSGTAGTLRYTDDGGDPSISSTLFASSVKIPTSSVASVTIKAIGYPGSSPLIESEIGTTVFSQLNKPRITLTLGGVEISGGAGEVFFYQTKEVGRYGAFILYGGNPFSLGSTLEIKAFAAKLGSISSGTEELFITPDPAPTFTDGRIDLAGNLLKIEITPATAGATIFYTIDGSQPDNTDTAYTVAFEVARDISVIKAIAYDVTTGVPSLVGTQNIGTLNPPTAMTLLTDTTTWVSYVGFTGADPLDKFFYKRAISDGDLATAIFSPVVNSRVNSVTNPTVIEAYASRELYHNSLSTTKRCEQTLQPLELNPSGRILYKSTNIFVSSSDVLLGTTKIYFAIDPEPMTELIGGSVLIDKECTLVLRSSNSDVFPSDEQRVSYTFALYLPDALFGRNAAGSEVTVKVAYKDDSVSPEFPVPVPGKEIYLHWKTENDSGVLQSADSRAYAGKEETFIITIPAEAVAVEVWAQTVIGGVTKKSNSVTSQVSTMPQL